MVWLAKPCGTTELIDIGCERFDCKDDARCVVVVVFHVCFFLMSILSVCFFFFRWFRWRERVFFFFYCGVELLHTLSLYSFFFFFSRSFFFIFSFR